MCRLAMTSGAWSFRCVRKTSFDCVFRALYAQYVLYFIELKMVMFLETQGSPNLFMDLQVELNNASLANVPKFILVGPSFTRKPSTGNSVN